MRTITYIVRLSRWKEHIGFVLPLTLLGTLLAQRLTGSGLGFRVLALFVANFLSVAFAFMINDVEDAEDDLFVKQKALRNPISSGKMTKEVGYFICGLVAIGALSIFVFLGTPVLWVGITLIAISFLYSSKPLRLKSWPVVDIVSHSLMLGGLLIFSSFLAYSNEWGSILYLVIAVCLVSAYGQIYNQLRDFDADKKAGLKNTTILLGKTRSLYLSYLSLLLAFILILVSVIKGIFPFWLILTLGVGVFLSREFLSKTDVTGVKAVDFTGGLQSSFYFVLNAVVLLWFGFSLFTSMF